MYEYKAMLMNYANFRDRTSLRGYWMAFLVNFVIGLVISFITYIIPSLGFVATLYGLATMIPTLAIAIRRLRDANLHWALIFTAFIPVVGSIVLIVLLCRPTANYQGMQV